MTRHEIVSFHVVSVRRNIDFFSEKVTNDVEPERRAHWHSDQSAYFSRSTDFGPGRPQ
jgi:hypothetical protein